MAIKTRRFKVLVNEDKGKVSCKMLEVIGAKKLLIIGHGAGAGFEHPFMEALAKGISQLGISTVRYQFPYMENGKKVPDRPKTAHATIQAVLNHIHAKFPEQTLFLSGKSFGGRMASQVAATGFESPIKGLIFFGFPLHAPGRDSLDRAEHLREVKQAMLFLQGSRDALANIDLMKTLNKSLRKAKLVIYEWANHSFKVPKKSGTTHEEIIEKICQESVTWIKSKK